jgi:hypothetical protein
MADGVTGEVTSIPDLLLDLVSRMSGVERAVSQAPTHEGLNRQFNELRKDYGERNTATERHVAALIEKQEAQSTSREVERELRFLEKAGTIAAAAAKAALAEQKQLEEKARQDAQKTDADLERRIRTANRNGLGGLIVGVAGIGYAIGKGMGLFP